MPSIRLPGLNRVMIAGNLTGEPDNDADDLGMMNITEMKKNN